METAISNILLNRIMLLDGAMGTMIQKYRLDETAYRGNLYKDFPKKLAGNNELLSFSQPGILREIHTAYLQAGADIIETNTFNANAISQAPYGLQHLCFEMNLQAARLAKSCCRPFNRKNPSKPRFVAGSMGPTDKALSLLSLSDNVLDQGSSFDALSEAYYIQTCGLIKGGADILLLETIIDTLNAKAAIRGIRSAFQHCRKQLPLMISLSLSGTAGRILSGQNLEAAYHSLMHAGPLSFGLNCSFGAADMFAWLEKLSGMASCFVSAHPNAGLPDEMGEYSQTPNLMQKEIAPFLEHGFINILGGCCGTTPEHISAMAELLNAQYPLREKKKSVSLVLCGLEALSTETGTGAVLIGEKTNVAGSRAFANAMEKKDLSAALSLARQQVEAGAEMLDVCMDGLSVDPVEAMRFFLNGISSDVQLAHIPLMIDSSDFQLIQVALKMIQGKSVVNSISLKNGEQEFLSKADWLHTMGAAVVVMLFDEEGQASTYERKISIAQRSYDLLQGLGFPPEDIIFDPNVLAIGTGMPEHNDHAVAFIRACEWIKQHLPHVKVSAGVSNLSFAFRGHKSGRKAIHEAFVRHAVLAGLDFIIADPGESGQDQTDTALAQLAEDLVMNRTAKATAHMLTYCNQHPATANRAQQTNRQSDTKDQRGWSAPDITAALGQALTLGQEEEVFHILNTIVRQGLSPLEVIEGPLAAAMQELGQHFAEGRLYLPQLIISARLMKKAVHQLHPETDIPTLNDTAGKKKVILATVKGDVHDIGKNIVGIVLACNGFEVVDLGVMVPPERIAEAIKQHQADLLGLSGLISPSLDEMINTLACLNELQISLPVLIGGASTSPLHTAVKMASIYRGTVAHVRDASAAATTALHLTHQEKQKAYVASLKEQQKNLSDLFSQKQKQTAPLTAREAEVSGPGQKDSRMAAPAPLKPGIHYFDNYPLEQLIPCINWTGLLHAWQIRGSQESIERHTGKRQNADMLLAQAREMLIHIIEEKQLRASGVIGLFEAYTDQQYIILVHDHKEYPLHMPDKHKNGLMGYPFHSFTDFISRKGSGLRDYAGAFALSAGFGAKAMAETYRAQHDDFSAILIETLAGRLTEAFSEHMHERVRKEFWGYAPEETTSAEALLQGDYQGIRPAPGYPGWKEHSAKRMLLQLLDPGQQTGIGLTETFSMTPASSATGLYLWTPKKQSILKQ